jgi:hypothetical protein
MRAACLIRPAPHYRRGAFVRGLEQAGYSVDLNDNPVPSGKDDVLVIWNRYGSFNEVAKRYEKAGCRVIVAENGYAGRDAEGRQYYALSANWHQRPLLEPQGPRFQTLGIEPTPWREGGDHVLVCLQRGFGVPPHGMPSRWAREVVERLRLNTRRPIRVRPHPEDVNVPAKDRTRKLTEDLVGAWAVVVWSSTAAVKSLLAGIPVFYCAPHCIVGDAALNDLSRIEKPYLGERGPALEAMAWGQWSVAELEAGIPFRCLLSHTGEGESRKALPGVR